jgi:hypothetical protein
MEYKVNTAIAKREARRRQRASLNKFVTNLEHDTYRTQPKVYKMLKQISKYIKNSKQLRKHIWKRISATLWKIMDHNKHKWPRISMELKQSFRYLNNIKWIRKRVKINKNGKNPGKDIINSELYKLAPEEFKLRLLEFLNNIYTENHIPKEWRNAIVIPVFNKGDRKDPKNYSSYLL